MSEKDTLMTLKTQATGSVETHSPQSNDRDAVVASRDGLPLLGLFAVGFGLLALILPLFPAGLLFIPLALILGVVALLMGQVGLGLGAILLAIASVLLSPIVAGLIGLGAFVAWLGIPFF